MSLFDALRDESGAKLKFRNRALEGLEATLLAKHERLARLWDVRLSHQITDLPEFSVFRMVQRAMREAAL